MADSQPSADDGLGVRSTLLDDVEGWFDTWAS